MKTTTTQIPGLLIFEPDVHVDQRGYLLETWHHGRYAAAGVTDRLVQDNLSVSRAGVLRGLHFQHPHGQAKLLSVIQGAILDVAVDVRRGSPSFGRWVAVELSDTNHRQFYLPVGFAHGFCVLSETACVAYKCSEEYHPESARTIRWDDPALGIEWPVTAPTLSEKDATAPRLSELPVEHLPPYLG